jgi:hypothetical protein
MSRKRLTQPRDVDLAPERPTPMELAELEELDRKRYPSCRTCGMQTYPGKPCGLSRCPWQREDGKVIQTRNVGG